MARSQVKVRLNAFGGDPDAVIEIDGVNIADKVHSIEFKRNGNGQQSEVTIGLALPELDYEGEAEIEYKVTMKQHDSMLLLGWTPPYKPPAEPNE